MKVIKGIEVEKQKLIESLKQQREENASLNVY